MVDALFHGVQHRISVGALAASVAQDIDAALAVLGYEDARGSGLDSPPA